jgi:hypothetical protein
MKIEGLGTYFGDAFNIMDFMGCITVIIASILGLQPPSEEINGREVRDYRYNLLLAGTTFMVFRALFYLRVFTATRSLIMLTYQTVIDLQGYLVVLFAS